MNIQVYGCQDESIVDGKGIRFVLFTQGCPHNCEGCHNPESHNFMGGKSYDTKDLLNKIFKNPLLDGVTFSGGEPFCQVDALIELAKEIKNKKLNIWTYTGYLFEDLIEMSKQNSKILELLSYIDVLIDGKFDKNLKSLLLFFRGSKNQRIIDVQNTLLNNNKVIEIDYQDKKY